MKNNNFRARQSTSYLSVGNVAYLEALYDAFLVDPASVDAPWRTYFESLPKAEFAEISHEEIKEQFIRLAEQRYQPSSKVVDDSSLGHKQGRVQELINAYRNYGHYQANLDPLQLSEKASLPELELSFYELTQADFNTVFSTEILAGKTQATLQEIYTTLRETYCGSMGIEYMYICNVEQRRWLQQRLEQSRSKSSFSVDKKRRILEKLTAAEGLERYLGSKYVGQKRFSLEGGDSLIPLLDEIVQQAASYHSTDIVIGMAHRGRLNVLVNILGKLPSDLFKEFEGKKAITDRSGDVKYHMGFSTDLKMTQGSLHLTLGFNPSHLEIIDPVVVGSVRARQQRAKDEKREKIIPVLIHGDAAFAGQGVVMETFQCSQTRGYATGGTIHIVVNNQVGFTTSNPQDTRSTPYCTDITKMVQSPVIHVNADDVEAVVFAAQLALDFRMQFKKDVVIDLVCFRRHGHNESDEPAATQPVMYKNIKQHPGTRKLYADKLSAEGVLSQEEADQLINLYRQTLDKGDCVLDNVIQQLEHPLMVNWSVYENQPWNIPFDTGVSAKKLKTLAETIEQLPENFVLQPQVARMMDERRKMTAGQHLLNWGYAETLAYASLLAEGFNIRISGQDCGRGTFAHRHAVLHDFNTAEVFIPLQRVAQNRSSVEIIDSFLSEEAVLGFEYGYASTDPKTLVVWEAQFGDFANGAQVVIDQFISSGEQKWGRLCGLVMLLPHGYEGQGPEHSSARLERYLQLCAQHNMQVCVPSTPAQMFHLLRRQMLRPLRKPLIVMTPKSLLRHKLAVSTLADLEQKSFLTVLPEIDEIDVANVRKIIICSGKVYYDLLEERRKREKSDIAVLRLEQLYPFDTDTVIKEIQLYKNAQEIIWCQEEPKNQGAWYQIQHRLLACITKEQRLVYVGRQASASTAAGYPSLHHEQQIAFINEALT